MEVIMKSAKRLLAMILALVLAIGGTPAVFAADWRPLPQAST